MRAVAGSDGLPHGRDGVEAAALDLRLSLSLRFRGFQECGHGLERAGVENILFAEPAFSREADAESEVVQALRGVGIGVDRAEHALVPCPFPPAPVHVQSHRAAIEFDDRSRLCRAVDDHRVIHRIRLALEKQAAGEMAEHGDVRVLHRAANPAGHFHLG